MSSHRITEVHVEGMRTLADVTLKLDGLTVLIGDNGTGKSTLVEVCELLRCAASGSFGADLTKIHGGARSLLRFGCTQISLAVGVASGDHTYEYAFTVNENGLVTKETLTALEEPPTVILSRREYNDRRSGNFDILGAGDAKWFVEPNELGMASFGRNPPHPAIAAVLEALREIDVHLPFEAGPRWGQRVRGLVSPLRESSIIAPANRLSRFGDNIANVFNALRNDYSETHWRETMDYVQLGLGHNVESINTRADPSGGAIALRLKYKGINEQVPAFSLSDGMLAYLCFVALYRMAPKRSLLVFDEPEKHLHPELLMRVLGFFEAMAQQYPVVLATHSDRLLDGLTDPAGSVVLCKLNEGRATSLIRPDADVLADWLTDYRGLGDIRSAGHAGSVLVREEQ